jgi:hypothetical protein
MLISKDKPIVLPDGKTLDPTTKVGVFDAAGQQIPYVFSFDTETCEVEMLIKLKDEEGEGDDKIAHLLRDADLKPLRAKFVIPGSYVMTSEGKYLR